MINPRISAPLLLVLIVASGLLLATPIVAATGPPYSWTGPTDVLPQLGQDNLPTAVQASNGTLWLAWQTFHFSATRPDIVVRTLTNGTWGSLDKRTSSGFNTSPALAQLRNGTIMLFWSQRQTVSFNIYYERFSVDQFGNGAWSTNVHLTTTTFNDTSPAASVAVDGSLWLFWQRSNQSCASTCTQTKEIYYKTLKTGSWSAETKITGSASDTNWNWLPSSVITSDGRVRLAWSKGGQSAGVSLTSPIIYYKTYNGSAWSTETQATFPTPGSFGDQHASIIQDRNGTIWLFWARTSLTTPVFILYNRFSTDNGVTWSTETQMTFEASGIDSQTPWAVQGNSVGDKTIHVFYSSDRTNSDYDIWTLVSPSISPVHHVGVLSATPSLNAMYAGGLPGKETSNETVSVTLLNYGDFAENVQTSVTVSNTTTISLGTQTWNIGISGSITIYFPWNTTGVRPSRYTISVTTSLIGATETPGNQGDSSVRLKNGIWLQPWGDVDQDGSVTLEDVSVFFFDYGFGDPAFGFTSCGTLHCKYFPFEDIANHHGIDIINVGIAVRNYGTFT